MSRGHGRTQRLILAALKKGQERTLPEIVAAIYDGKVDKAGYVATRRALLGLAGERYVIQTARGWARVDGLAGLSAAKTVTLSAGEPVVPARRSAGHPAPRADAQSPLRQGARRKPETTPVPRAAQNDPFSVWAANMSLLVKRAKGLPDWPAVDHNWLRDPRPASVAKMREALEGLLPKMAEAEALLKRARGGG